MSDGTIIVDARGAARRMEALGMRCDAKEIPDPIGDEKPTGWWIVGLCVISGSANKNTSDGDSTPFKMQGTAALAVTEDRLLGIGSTNSKADPAVWFSWSLPSLRIEAEGSQGVFKKRPTIITVQGPGAFIVMRDVNGLYRNINRYQSGQENSLLKALGVAV